MTARKYVALGLKTILLGAGLTLIFIIGAMVSGLGRPTSAAAAATAAARQPANALLWLFVASLIQAVVVAYLVLEAKWAGWKLTGAIFLVALNLWLQTAIETGPYLRGHVPPNFGTQAVVMGLFTAILFAPFAVWILGRFRRASREELSERFHWSLSRWAGTLAATTVAFVALYYLCGYYIAWQNPALRQFYSGTTAIRSFWGQIAWTWSVTPWTFARQAGRALLFIALTLPAVRTLRGGSRRVAFGVALMYAAWDGSPGLLAPNPIMPLSVAHTHMVELAVWGVLFGGLVGRVFGQGSSGSPAEPRVAEAE
jgi:hypothetical protein